MEEEVIYLDPLGEAAFGSYLANQQAVLGFPYRIRHSGPSF